MNTTQEHILNLLNGGDNLLFITGGAGTGKSYTVDQWAETLEAEALCITAPTGVAALNINGQTLHRTFNIPFSIIPDQIEYQATIAANKMKRDKKVYINTIQNLLIDEISMTRSDVLSFVEAVLRHVRGNDDPWGGIRVVFVGDPFQLPPVVPNHEKKKLPRPWFFQSEAWAMREILTLNLTKIYRQEDTSLFAQILNRIRTGDISGGDLIPLNKRRTLTPDPKAVIVATTNKKVDTINETELAKVGSKEHHFIMDYENYDPNYKIQNNIPAQEHLFLKVGCRVMILINGQSYVNGSLGEVTGIDCDPAKSEKDHIIWVKLDDSDFEVPIKRNTWEASENSMAESGDKIQTIALGRATQFPLRLGYAITVHKSQGLTFDNMHFSADYIFERGQAYVALSRATALEALSLSKPLRREMIMVDYAVKKFMQET